MLCYKRTLSYSRTFKYVALLDHLYEFRDHAELPVLAFRAEFHGFEFGIQRSQNNQNVAPLILARRHLLTGIFLDGKLGARIGDPHPLNEQALILPASDYRAAEQAQTAIGY